MCLSKMSILCLMKYWEVWELILANWCIQTVYLNELVQNMIYRFLSLHKSCEIKVFVFSAAIYNIVLSKKIITSKPIISSNNDSNMIITLCFAPITLILHILSQVKCWVFFVDIHVTIYNVTLFILSLAQYFVLFFKSFGEPIGFCNREVCV